jgi:hypothetical protein
VRWFYEILNALIQHFSRHGLWTVPTGKAFLLLTGVGVELSLMFSVAGLIFSKILPAGPKMKILGINNRLFIAIVNAAFSSPSLKSSWQKHRLLFGFIHGGDRSLFILACIFHSLSFRCTATTGSQKSKRLSSGLSWQWMGLH